MNKLPKKSMTKLKIIIITIFVIMGLSLLLYKLELFTKKAGKQTNLATSVEKEPSIPLSYHIEDVSYYGEKKWCWGSSALMLLMNMDFSEEKIQNARTIIKSKGLGGPPDMFIGFKEFDLLDNLRIAYSTNYVKRYSDFYNTFLINPKEQTILFNNKDEAFEYLKKLISSDTIVMIVVHYGNHFVIATGYDENYIYTNDPGWDNGYDYKIDSDPNLKQRRIPVDYFLDEWSISGQEKEIGGKIGFPGDYGIIWFVE